MTFKPQPSHIFDRTLNKHQRKLISKCICHICGIAIFSCFSFTKCLRFTCFLIFHPLAKLLCLSLLEKTNHSCGTTHHPVMKVCAMFFIFNKLPVLVGVQSVEEIVTAVLVRSVRELKDKWKEKSKLRLPTEEQKGDVMKREEALVYVASLD